MGVNRDIMLVRHPIPMIVMVFVAVLVGLLSEVRMRGLKGVLLWLHLGGGCEGI